jgi:hypothetical protein
LDAWRLREIMIKPTVISVTRTIPHTWYNLNNWNFEKWFLIIIASFHAHLIPLRSKWQFLFRKYNI